MKNAKKPTLVQKKILKSHGLIPDNWLVLRDAGLYLEVISKAELARCSSKNQFLYKKPRTKYIGKSREG